jgi:hypothetical protein
MRIKLPYAGMANVPFSAGTVHLNSDVRPGGDSIYIVAAGVKFIRLSRRFSSKAEAIEAWRTGFDVEAEEGQEDVTKNILKLLVGENIATVID